MRHLAEGEWRSRAAAHGRRVAPWVTERLARRAADRSDPVDDFLWQYYSLRPAQLAQWHPGLGTVLAGAPPVAGRHPYRRVDGGWTAVADPDHPGWRRVLRALPILRATASRPVRPRCFGMHEWAMVYGSAPDDVRHAQVPLRLPPARIQQVVAEVGLRCTHFDAYRFFTPSAAARQRPLTRQAQASDEQPACLHAGMDLYRYAYEAQAYVGSDLVADCFEHARAARSLDMAASPYDLTGRGLAAIPMELPEGRREYVRQQEALAARAQGLRAQLIKGLEHTVTSAAQTRRETAQSS